MTGRWLVLVALAAFEVAPGCGADSGVLSAQPCGKDFGVEDFGDAWETYKRDFADEGVPVPDDWRTFANDAEDLLDRIADDLECARAHDDRLFEGSGNVETREAYEQLSAAQEAWLAAQREQLVALRQCIRTAATHDGVLDCMGEVYSRGLGDRINDAVSGLEEAKRVAGIE